MAHRQKAQYKIYERNRIATNNCGIVGGATHLLMVGFYHQERRQMNMEQSAIITWIMIPIAIALLGGLVTVIVLVIRALLKYLKSKDVRVEKAETRKSLGEALKEQRTRCKMTQEFVAESLGVSRQAVSKWENGTSDPSTSNLIALAKLFGISAEELLSEIKNNEKAL